MKQGEADAPFVTLGRIGFVGAGAVGGSLAVALAVVGAQVVAVTAQHTANAAAVTTRIPGCMVASDVAGVLAQSDCVILATPDDAITKVAAVAPWRAGQLAIHLSGAHGAELLAAAEAKGAHTAALHPLMTFPQALREAPADDILARLQGATWALEATDETLAAALRALVVTLGGRTITLRVEDRVPYHLSAVLASNYVTALLGAAVSLWQDALGVDGEMAREALLPLLRASVTNLETVGLPAALTGPIARGDLSVVRAHLAWLDAHAAELTNGPALRAAYVALARLAIPLAQSKGTLSTEAARALEDLL
ncbi:MAG: Rossmann-like and DUF2520 domain-containing protein [Ktedonobacterales bacterium]